MSPTDQVVRGACGAGAAADLDGMLKAFLRMAEAREREHLAPRLRAIHCPVRLLVGSAPHEGGVPPHDLDELRDSLPSFSIDLVSGSGHYIHEDRPQAVVDAVEASLGGEYLRLLLGSHRPGQQLTRLAGIQDRC